MKHSCPWKIAAALSATTLPLCAQPSAEQRALDYLAREVPRWSRDNHCFSCHNNGDGARALYVAMQQGYSIPRAALADTTQWLSTPDRWDENRGNPAFSDKKLARIQFAAALGDAVDAGVISDGTALVRAAESLLPLQEVDGSWQVDTGVTAGSPATYGTTLATYMCTRTLERAGKARFANPVAKAKGWLSQTRPLSVLDMAAMLLALPHDESVQQKCMGPILRAQAGNGGWGPQPHAPAEPFDTAVVLLALHAANESNQLGSAIEHGRAYLITLQQPSGGWQETTRPPGAQSYAQHISTSAWATLALLLTHPKP